MVPDNVRRLEHTMRQAKAAGYNCVVLDDFKFQILDRVDSGYPATTTPWQRSMTPGELLADGCRRCAELVRAATPSAKILAWSDMFDPFHNGHDHYYLVNGDAFGSWEGLDKDVIVANWNFTASVQSLKWFASHGHSQIIAVYYDRALRELFRMAQGSGRRAGIVWRHVYDMAMTI